MKAQRRARFDGVGCARIEYVQAIYALHSAGLCPHQSEAIWTLLPSIEGDEATQRRANNRPLRRVAAQVVPVLQLRQQLIAQEAHVAVRAVILAYAVHGRHKHGYYRWNSAHTYQVVEDGRSLAHAQVNAPIMKIDARVWLVISSVSRRQVHGVGTYLPECFALDGFFAQQPSQYARLLPGNGRTLVGGHRKLAAQPESRLTHAPVERVEHLTHIIKHDSPGIREQVWYTAGIILKKEVVKASIQLEFMLIMQKTSSYWFHKRLARIVAIPLAADTDDCTWLLLVDEVCRIAFYYRKVSCKHC